MGGLTDKASKQLPLLALLFLHGLPIDLFVSEQAEGELVKNDQTILVA